MKSSLTPQLDIASTSPHPHFDGSAQPNPLFIDLPIPPVLASPRRLAPIPPVPSSSRLVTPLALAVCFARVYRKRWCDLPSRGTWRVPRLTGLRRLQTSHLRRPWGRP